MLLGIRQEIRNWSFIRFIVVSIKRQCLWAKSEGGKFWFVNEVQVGVLTKKTYMTTGMTSQIRFCTFFLKLWTTIKYWIYILSLFLGVKIVFYVWDSKFGICECHCLRLNKRLCEEETIQFRISRLTHSQSFVWGFKIVALKLININGKVKLK